MARPFRERSDKPRPTFYQKPKPEKKAPLRATAGGKVIADPYQDGKTRIFLDDERPCPGGWLPVKNVPAFVAALQACPPDNLVGVSFDWHLGTGAITGHNAVEAFIDHLIANPSAFTSLKIVNCHSSDLTEATTMARRVANAFREDDLLSNVFVNAGSPQEAQHALLKYL